MGQSCVRTQQCHSGVAPRQEVFLCIPCHLNQEKTLLGNPLAAASLIHLPHIFCGICLKVLLVFLLFIFQCGVKMEAQHMEEQVGLENDLSCGFFLTPFPWLVNHDMHSTVLANKMYFQVM